MTFSPSDSQGYFLDPNLIIPDDPVDQRYRVKDLYQQVADCVNMRGIELYYPLEIETGQQWFVPGNPQRYYSGWRLVVQIPDLSAGGDTKTVNTSIDSILKYTKIYGMATDGTNWYQLSYADPAGTGNISISATTASVTVTSGATAPALTNVIAVLEYIKGSADGEAPA